MEDEANQFALAFLLPPQEMIETFRGRKVTLSCFVAKEGMARIDAKFADVSTVTQCDFGQSSEIPLATNKRAGMENEGAGGSRFFL